MDTLIRVLSFLEKLKLRRKQIQDLLSVKEEKMGRGVIIFEMAANNNLNEYWYKRNQILRIQRSA